jgi:hypothetical protein
MYFSRPEVRNFARVTPGRYVEGDLSLLQRVDVTFKSEPESVCRSHLLHIGTNVVGKQLLYWTLRGKRNKMAEQIGNVYS